MAQPTAYNRSFSFTNYQASNPSDPLPGDSLDGELNDVKTTLDGVLANLARIQNDDGTLKNESVGAEQLSDDLEIGFTVPTAWATATAYTASPASTVFFAGIFYRCRVSHTSGTFATDLTALKWVEIADFTAIPVGTASQVAFTPAGNIASSTVQAALAELDTEKAALTHTHVATDISDSTTIGRSILTGATAAAIRSALSVSASSTVQPLDDTLTALAAMTTAANKLPYATGVDTFALADFTAFARTILDDADAATVRGTLGLATSAIVATGTSGATIPLCNGANTWADTQTFTKAPKLTGSIARCTLAFSKTSSATFSDITGMSVTLETGKKYVFRAWLSYTTGGAAGGGKFAVGGAAVIATLQANGSITIDNADPLSVSSTTSTGSTICGVSNTRAAQAVLYGYIDCTTGGTFTIQFAQNASNVTASVVNIGSYMEVVEIS